jgi:hypothetical protein
MIKPFILLITVVTQPYPTLSNSYLTSSNIEMHSIELSSPESCNIAAEKENTHLKELYTKIKGFYTIQCIEK